VNAPVYTTRILRLASSLPAPRGLERVDGRAELRSPTCGATITTEVMLDGGKLASISQSVRACAFGQASAALLESGATGRSAAEVAQALEQLGEWLEGKREEPGDWPDLGELAPARPKLGRHGAILLPFRALLAAMTNAR
jgi:NifU-like protein involved in Fe-S cluster formation